MIWVPVFSILTEKCQSCHSSKLTLDLTWLEPKWMLLQSCAWITRELFIIQSSFHNLGMNIMHKINFYGVISTSKNCTYFKKTEVINLSSVLMLNKYHLIVLWWTHDIIFYITLCTKAHPLTIKHLFWKIDASFGFIITMSLR